MIATSVTLLSFGYLHGAEPDVDEVVDVRDLISDLPARLREMTGLDKPVRQHVLATRGTGELLDLIEHEAVRTLHRSSRGHVTVAIGCTGGRHRSVVLAEALGARLVRAGWVTEVAHRDVGKPVVSGRSRR